MEYRVLGPLEVADGRDPIPLGGHRQRLVLAVLIAHRAVPLSTDRLVDLVWGDEPPASARKSLQAYVSRLRSLLPPGAICSDRGGYRLDLDAETLDADAFERLVAAARELGPADPSAAAELLASALDLWRGDAFGDLGSEPAVQLEALRLEELRLKTIEDVACIDARGARPGAAVADLEKLVVEHPYREKLWAALMTSLYRSGRQVEALRRFESFRSMLRTDLGLEPSPELCELEERILLHDPDLAPTRSGGRRSRNPYVGLRPFLEADDADFFGRSALVAEMLALLEHHGGDVLAVVGPSGSGKSSVVRAGLIPALHGGAIDGSQRWQIAVCRPGSRPFASLQRAVAAGFQLPGQPAAPSVPWVPGVIAALRPERDFLLIVVDQLEELYTMVDDETTRAEFLECLARIALTDRCRVAVTLRADYYDRPLEHSVFAQAIHAATITVLPMNPEELAAAATGPAANAGLRLEQSLVAELVADVGGRPGSLPLFEFVLTELAADAPDGTLTTEAYRRLGGLAAALDLRAEEIFSTLDDGERTACHQALLRMVTVDDKAVGRRRVGLGELEALPIDGPTLGRVIDMLCSERLLTAGRDPLSGHPTIEIAHEALLDGWDRFAGWIAEAHGDLGTRRSLSVETEEWIGSGRDRDYLLTGSRLERFEEWSAATTVALTAREQEFLDASLERRAEEQVEARAHAIDEEELVAQSGRRMRRMTIAVIATLVLSTFLTYVAIDHMRSRQRSDADRFIAAVSAEALTHSAEDPELAATLALYAVDEAARSGRVLPLTAVTAMHLSLQERSVVYPNDNLETAVLVGPSGLRGVYAIDFADLVELTRQGARPLSAAECRKYLETDTCQDLPEVPQTDVVVAALPVPDFPTMPLAGTHVSVGSPLVSSEGDALRAELQLVTEATGILIDYQGRESLLVDLAASLHADLPDVVVVPQPSVVQSLAKSGLLVDLSTYIDKSDTVATYGPYLAELATVPGSEPDSGLYGVPVELTLKSLIWYPAAEFERAGYDVPETFDELVALTHEMIDDGRTPWCLGEESGSADGWPGTDWIENIVLKIWGPDVYDDWTRLDVPFSSPEVAEAFERYGDVVLVDGALYGGRGGAANIYFGNAARPMFEHPPRCWLLHQATFAPSFFPIGTVLGSDVAAFPFPTITPEYSTAAIGSGQYVVAFRDRPEVREVVRRMTGAQFGTVRARLDSGFISARADFDTAAYSPLTKQFHEMLHTAIASNSLRFDASDQMPPSVGMGTFWEGMIHYLLVGPDHLDEILHEIDTGAGR